MEERGKSLSTHQFYPDEVAHAPATPTKLGQTDPNTVCNNWLEDPFNKAIFEEPSVKKSYSSWEGNLGSTSQINEFGGRISDKFSMDDVETWQTISCIDLLALADASIRKNYVDSSGSSSSGGGGPAETQQYGRLNLPNCVYDLNAPPETVTELSLNTGLSLQFTPVTPDHVKRAEDKQAASDMVNSNEDDRMNLAADISKRFNLDEQSQAGVSTLVEENQDFEKGLAEQTDLNETPQPKEKRRKHRPKVVTEGKPKRARKPATPKPETPKPATGKRKYVRKKGIEKPTETPTLVEGSGPIDPSPDQQTKKSCKRKINFDESELGTEVEVEKIHIDLTVEKTCSGSQEVETCQIINETQSASPITPNKTELPQGRSRKGHTKAKCRINFSQETHDKGPSSVPSSNESRCSTSACFNNGEFSSEVDGIKRLQENTLETYGALEAFLSTFTDCIGGGKQGMQLPVINKKKKVEKNQGVMTTATNVGMQISSQNSNKMKGKALSVYDWVSFAGMIDGRHQQHTYIKSQAPDFQVSIATKKKTMKKCMVPSSYHDHQRFTTQIGYYPSLRCKSVYDIHELVHQFERLHINSDAVVPYLSRHHEKNALVVYQREGSLVPYEGLFNPLKKRKPRAKVDLDDETNRVWMLLLEDINSEGIDGTDEAKAKWWEEERRVFRGRADSFIARMHLVQGDRRFSRWKGSVLDSVVGVFLTQNVSDHLSSSAFMSLAARYPLKPNSSNEPFHEEESVLSVKEPYQVDESADHGPMILQDPDPCEKETVNSNEVSKNIVSSIDLNDNSECEVPELSKGDLVMYKEAVIDQTEVNEIVSSQNSADTSPCSAQSSIANTTERSNLCSVNNSEKEQMEGSKATDLDRYTCVELLHMQGPTTIDERKIIEKNSGMCASEESGISAEFASQTTVQMVKTTSSQESGKSCNYCEVQEVFDITNVTAETYRAAESNNFEKASGKMVQKVTKEKTGKKQIKVEWDKLRLQAEVKQKRGKTPYTMDSLDYEAVRTADVSEVADAIKERGMNNVLAGRIKDVLDRLVREHGSMDLEWLRDVPPDKAKEYLLSFRGLGLKSVECIRLLTLHHLAFPVDTNVGRIAVRLGWVPLQPLPESLQLHLLELYPVLESIQKYLWPRLCKLDQRTLYELHYQMITFGKVFCTKTKPNCNACPLRGECRHFASAFTSARLSLPAPEASIASLTENRTGQSPVGMIDLPPPSEQLKPLSEVQNCNPVIEEPATAGPIVEVPTTAGPIVEVPTTAGPIVEVPATPEPIVEVPASPEPEQIQQVFDIEDFCEDSEEIPMIKLNIEEFTQNLQTYMERHMELGEGDMSKALVALKPEAASIPTPKLKNVNQLRTEHQVYELPDSHPLLEGLDTREPDDPCSYLLAIWTPGETADSIQPPEGQCCSHESGFLCNEETCFFCNSTREANSQTVRGTLLIPCRTAMRGSFPLNGTYFQVNEVFADHESSLNPIDVPRAWLWNLPRRTVYFGTSIPTIFKGLTTEDIQYCFWRGFVCVRGFDQKTRAPRPLMARLHFPASRLKKPKPKTDEKEKLML